MYGVWTRAVPWVVLLSLYACSGGLTEEEKVRGVIVEASKRAEEKDLKGFMSLVSRDYADDSGNDYDAIKRMVFYHFMRTGDISVVLRSMDIEVSGEKALAEVNAIITEGRGVIPEDMGGYRFTVIFRKEGSEWKVINAEWKDVGVRGFL